MASKRKRRIKDSVDQGNLKIYGINKTDLAVNPCAQELVRCIQEADGKYLDDPETYNSLKDYNVCANIMGSILFRYRYYRKWDEYVKPRDENPPSPKLIPNDGVGSTDFETKGE